MNLPPANRPNWSIAASKRFQTRPATRTHLQDPLPAAAATRLPPAMARPCALPPVLLPDNVAA